MELKKRTRYICPVGGYTLGHASKWTGDLVGGRRPGDDRCSCGAEFVEVVEDGYTYRVQWEMVGPFAALAGGEPEYHETHRDTTDRASALAQLRQLAEWEETGAEPVRNVRLLRAETTWVDVDPATL